MNWLQPPAEPPQSDALPIDPLAPSESNLNYWAARLTPLHDPAPGYVSPAPVERAEPKLGKEVVFVGCNRVGTEEGEGESAGRVLIHRDHVRRD
jgi:protein N-terminal amidase